MPRTSNYTNRLSSICWSDGKCGNQLQRPDDGKIALARSNQPRRRPRQRPMRLDERQPNILEASEAMAALARIDGVAQGQCRPTNPRSCLSRSPDGVVVAAVAAACPSVKRMTVESSPNDNQPCNRWPWNKRKPSWCWILRSQVE